MARPGSFSLAELKALPSRTQITRHVCEEGWTAIGEWTGVPLSRVLDAVGLLPAARFVSYYSFDHLADSIDLLDALHPQTLLAYGMNGRDLPVQHGAPLRLRVERQMGYKSMKFLTAWSSPSISTTVASRATRRTAGPGTSGSEQPWSTDSGPRRPRVRRR